MSWTTSYQDFRNCVRNLKTDKSFLKDGPHFGRESAVVSMVDLVLSHPYDSLRKQFANCFPHPSYCIGMAYVYKLAQMESNQDGSHILDVLLVSNLGEIREELRKSRFDPLSGVMFIRDSDCERTQTVRNLIRLGAKQVGYDLGTPTDLTKYTTRGAPFFVANQKVLLSVTYGAAPITKNAAEKLKLYALSCMSTRNNDVTLTMRLFQDLKTVVSGLFGRVENPLCENKLECKRFKVAVCLGFKTFEHDNWLLQCAVYLKTKGHPVMYYFFDELLSDDDVNRLFVKSEWDRKTQDQAFESPKFTADFSTNASYQFILAPLNVVDYSPSAPFAEEPIFLTVPSPEKEFSVEITRRMGAHMKLIDFAENVVFERPN